MPRPIAERRPFGKGSARWGRWADLSYAGSWRRGRIASRSLELFGFSAGCRGSRRGVGMAEQNNGPGDGQAPGEKISTDQRADKQIPANPVFKSEMGKVAFVVLAFATIALGTLFVMAALDMFGPPDQTAGIADLPGSPPRTELYWLWDAFVWLVASGGILAKLLALLSAILTVGIGVIAETTRSRWLALTIISLCLAGVLFSVLLMWQLSAEPGLGMLRSPTDFDDDQYLLRLNGVLVAFAVWFLSFLGRQVGVSGLQLVKDVWKDWTGGNR